MGASLDLSAYLLVAFDSSPERLRCHLDVNHYAMVIEMVPSKSEHLAPEIAFKLFPYTISRKNLCIRHKFSN